LELNMAPTVMTESSKAGNRSVREGAPRLKAPRVGPARIRS